MKTYGFWILILILTFPAFAFSTAQDRIDAVSREPGEDENERGRDFDRDFESEDDRGVGDNDREFRDRDASEANPDNGSGNDDDFPPEVDEPDTLELALASLMILGLVAFVAKRKSA
ncbi:MAG: hypothetical protein NUW37_07295 [Planctomycetes bacterium]|nr:hypothetical protein [Planctomycetota bacterium]